VKLGVDPHSHPRRVDLHGAGLSKQGGGKDKDWQSAHDSNIQKQMQANEGGRMIRLTWQN
jgi:hypothetical protein